MLLVVEDGLDDRAPWAALRSEERRADTVVLLRRRSCGGIEATWIPRDVVLNPGEESIAILYGVSGMGGLRRALRRAMGVQTIATAVVRFDDVAWVIDRIGGVVVDLETMSTDGATGFLGGPGPVPMDGARAVSYLRSRDWETWDGTTWILSDQGDLARITRAQSLLGKVTLGLRHASTPLRLGMLARLGRHLSMQDELATARFLRLAESTTDLTFASIAVEDDVPTAERRSPLLPTDLGTMHRLRPVGDVHHWSLGSCEGAP